ncbi:hypothetical protein DFH11DRAFT_1878110 [Phellopilus nigrolimitatus]|nr:hypothetical protein DFH11DRAFT_1878110 [Phellopilus nigrolimitatus]
MLTRRELTLLLFALAVFVVAYNLDAARARLAPTPALSFSARALLGVQDLLSADGRRRAPYVDPLERAILGDWEVDARRTHDLGPHGVSADDQLKTWPDGNVPVTKLIAHVPGFTVLDNVLLVNGTLHLVSDHASIAFPRPEAILSTGLDSPYLPVLQNVRFLTRQKALQVLGYSAQRIAGTSLICFDQKDAIDSYTLLALHRAHAAASSSPTSTLPPPDRTIFANTARSAVSETGYALAFARAAFPYMVHLFAEDWADLALTARPAFLDRVLLADRVAAEHGAQAFDFAHELVAPLQAAGSVGDEKQKNGKAGVAATPIEATDKRLAFSPAFALPARANWATPVRAGVQALLLPPLPAGARRPRKALTYVAGGAAHLRDEDHAALARALRRLGDTHGWDVHVVERERGGTAGWAELVRAAAQSSVLLGVYGDALVHSALLRADAGPRAVVEFFPDGRFANENEFVTRALGVGYVAWRNTKKYPRGSLPPISPPTRADSRVLAVDVPAVVQFVKETMRRSA